MSIDSKGLPERFFSLFPRYKLWEIAECLYPGENGRKKQPRLSMWRSGREPIPMEILDRVVDLGLAKWDWLLTGREEASPPPAVASGGGGTAGIIGSVFQVMAALVDFAQHLQAGKSLNDIPELPELRDVVRSLEAQLAKSEQIGEERNQGNRIA